MTRNTRTPAIEPQPLRFSAQERAVVYEARQILLRHLNQNPVLTSWQAVLDYCALTIRGDVERFHVLYLDRKNRIIADELLSTGTVDHVPVYPREVVKRALLLVLRRKEVRRRFVYEAFVERWIEREERATGAWNHRWQSGMSVLTGETGAGKSMKERERKLAVEDRLNQVEMSLKQAKLKTKTLREE